MLKIADYVEKLLSCRPSRTKLRSLLKAQGLSWKKCRKLLRKADPLKRAAFIEKFQTIFERVCQEEHILLYIDEAHLHRDMDLGYSWSPKGQPDYRESACASLSDRINWYGVYNFTQGQCFIWSEGACNTDNTMLFLERVADWLGKPHQSVTIIWDGAPWHRAIRLKELAAELGFELIPLPGYSPDLNPIEGLWKWMREEVTQHHSYNSVRDLFDACKQFVDRINLDPDAIIKRLWPKFELDPLFEKLLIS